MQAASKKVLFAVGLAGTLVGATAASLYIHFLLPQNPSIRVVRQSDISSSSAYAFTDPLISVTVGGADAVEYVPLQQAVQNYIAASQAQRGLSSASVRFVDIEAAEGFTVNPDEQYDPASLTKVPLAMAYYELAESDPSVLSQKIMYTGKQDLDANEQIESPVQLEPGQGYTVEEMIEHMIRYSDNNAEQLLADHLSQIGQLDALQTLFADLGIKNDPNNPDDTTVQSYSLFLRILFNATYLDRDYSEKLLSLLSQSDFSQGIRSGVPDSVVVAQKFGDARIPDSQGNIIGAELQNCGIIYYSDHPYILCIMTKGANVNDLEQVISGISQIVYQSMQVKFPST